MDVGRWRAFVSKRKVEGRHGDADLSANLHVMKYSWVEPKHRKWQQSPPRVEVEVDEEHGYMLRVALTANRHKTKISTEQLQGLFIESLVEAGVFAGGGKGLQRIGVD